MIGHTVKKATNNSPWTILTLLGCITLFLVDLWRDSQILVIPLLSGTMPNFLSVPILTFGFLMVRYPEKLSACSQKIQSEKNWFWGLWITSLIITILWELAQIKGSLVFDVNDLYATVCGAAFTVLCYRYYRPNT